MRSVTRLWLASVLLIAACAAEDRGDDTDPGITTTSPSSTTEAPIATTSEPVTPTSSDASANLAAAEEFIDAFYSFEPELLIAAMESAESSQPWFVYYQGWAQGGNYQIVERHPCVEVGAGRVDCPVTVEDDLAKTLNYGFNVTDTFHLTFSDGVIVDVESSSDDPPIYDEALQWMFQNKADLLEPGNACEGLFDGGPTPAECAAAVVAGFEEFMELRG